MKKIALSALLVALLAACASTQQPAPAASTPTATTVDQKADEAEAKRKADEAAAKAAADAAEAQRKASEAAAAKADQDAKAAVYKEEQDKADADKRITEGLLKSKSVYFEFNAYDISDDYKSLIETHADYAKIGEAKIRIEGNADDRGSREYNLALGQKRANAVAKALEALGVDKANVETTSNGKEKPQCTEENEDCWSVNRRADIIYPGDSN